MKVPTKITPCPIIDSIIEIRFNSTVPEDAIFGIVYNKFHEAFPKVQNLPILDIPEQLRATDVNLKYAPYYQLIGDKFMLQVGPRVFSIANPAIYDGWENYSKIIYQSIHELNSLKIVDSVHRLGLRYTNFFENINIFEKINLHIKFNKKLLANKNSFYKTEFEIDGFTHNLQILNNSTVLNVNKVEKVGSIVDIDTFNNFNLDTLLTNPKNYIEKAHKLEKDLFFQIIDENFLKNNFNVEY